MDFFEAVRSRRSIRQYTNDPVPDAIIQKALEAAVLAPNSSNTQTWDFYWVQSPEKKAKLVHACLNQAAARTCAQMVVVTADPRNWRRSQKPMLAFLEQVKAPRIVKKYYKQLVPVAYTSGPLNIFGLMKWIVAFAIGIFQPMTRGPHFKGEIQAMAMKSAALAAENFVLAIAAQGYSTCMMEGFDEWRVRRLLKLRCSGRIAMVIAIGKEAERGTWGPQFRIPLSEVVHII